MPENNLYYIYIDSKIEGTIDQLMSYFQANIFYKDDCICIYFKFYKNIEKYINNKFHFSGIRYKFIRKNSDFVFQPHKVVFYLFNAQSNCRVVARRDLTHIFVTHGESHKLASIKPIIRIYDFVITSGQVGVERFLKAGIFNLQNILEESRVIPMGNTFIGQPKYKYDHTSDVLLYAPTWEGGVPSENYSSVSVLAGKILTQLLSYNSLSHLFIQMHPNLGHRDKKYLKLLKELIKKVKSHDIKITLIKSTLQFYDRWLFSSCDVICTNVMPIQKIRVAVVDISAMEMQCISEHIPTIVLYQKEQLTDLIIPNRVQYLYTEDQSMDQHNFANLDFNIRAAQISQHRDYLIGYQESCLADMSFQQRIHWLCNYAKLKKSQMNQKKLGEY